VGTSLDSIAAVIATSIRVRTDRTAQGICPDPQHIKTATIAQSPSRVIFASVAPSHCFNWWAVLYLLISLRGQLFRPDRPPLVPPGDPGVPPTQLPVSTVT
jgi:hypothetical protein